MRRDVMDEMMGRAVSHRCLLCNTDIHEEHRAFCSTEHRSLWKRYFWWTAYTVSDDTLQKKVGN
jgi:hypothetical protein